MKEARVVSQSDSAVTEPEVSGAEEAGAGLAPEEGDAVEAGAGPAAGEGVAGNGAVADDAGGEADAGVEADADETAEVLDQGSGEEPGEAEPGPPDIADLELEGEVAADYIEGLLDVADLDGDIDMDVEGDRAVVSVVGATLDELVGTRGEVLDALQELTRLAVHRQTGARTRIMIDVGGNRLRRRGGLAETGPDAAHSGKRQGEP